MLREPGADVVKLNGAAGPNQESLKGSVAISAEFRGTDAPSLEVSTKWILKSISTPQ